MTKTDARGRLGVGALNVDTTLLELAFSGRNRVHNESEQGPLPGCIWVDAVHQHRGSGKTLRAVAKDHCVGITLREQAKRCEILRGVRQVALSLEQRHGHKAEAIHCCQT